jgi:inorganic triphosphatase YgiF
MSRRLSGAASQHTPREDEILPWFDLIAEGFEKGRICGKWLLKTGAKLDRETAAEVVAKIDRRMKRVGDRYEDEELSREEYRDQLAKLRRQRDAYIAMTADEPDPKDLSTLASAWRSGDAAQRWEVLNALFERIHVRQDRKGEGYTPRMDRAKKVRMLISTAFASYYDWPEPEDGPGAMAARLRCGGAGI